jgi:hypothetical protein
MFSLLLTHVWECPDLERNVLLAKMGCVKAICRPSAAERTYAMSVLLQARIKKVAALLLTFLSALPTNASDPYAPDPLIEASMYAARAREQADTCYREAEKLADKAVHTARRFRSSSPRERDIASAFTARQEMFANQLHAQLEQGKRVQELLERALKDHRLQTAGELAQAITGMSCELSFQQLGRRLDSESQRAASLVELADSQLQSNPKMARKNYEHVAREIDRQFPGIEDRIAKAKSAEHGRHPGQLSGAAKVLVWTLGFSALGGAAYGASQSSGNRH